MRLLLLKNRSVPSPTPSTWRGQSGPHGCAVHLPRINFQPAGMPPTTPIPDPNDSVPVSADERIPFQMSPSQVFEFDNWKSQLTEHIITAVRRKPAQESQRNRQKIETIQPRIRPQDSHARLAKRVNHVDGGLDGYSSGRSIQRQRRMQEEVLHVDNNERRSGRLDDGALAAS
jgi:hypothetical protein